MTALACFWIVQAYQGWKNNPIVTTISTTGKPIFTVEFPAVTICGLGMLEDSIEDAFRNQIGNYLTDNCDKPCILTCCKDLTFVSIALPMPDDLYTAALDTLFQRYQDSYLKDLYPGLESSPTRIIEAMVAQSPDELLRADILMNPDYYDPCEVSYNRLVKKSEAVKPCGDDRAHDAANGVCYSILEKKDDGLEKAAKSCESSYAGLVDVRQI